jgi:dipicolinate synthase subunit A
LGEKTEGILPHLHRAEEGSLFFVGKADHELEEAAQKKGIHIISLLDQEIYRTENSLATAEGCLAEVIGSTERLLTELSILVCGYGNCGKAIARLFWLCGSEVWIFSREGSMKRAHEDGFNLYRAPGERMGMFDAVINTVPTPIFSPEFFSSMRPDSHFFQIASGLSGIEKETLSRLGIHFHPLPGLPGRYAPATEAETLHRIICETLDQIHTERK